MKRTDGIEIPDPDLVYLEIAASLAKLSTCPEGARHGCVIVKSGEIVATGYGSPKEPCPRCFLRDKFAETGIKDWSVCPAVHAERNAVNQGVVISGGTAYITRDPCDGCKALLEMHDVMTIVTPSEDK